jgi:hypothetical protein
MSIPEHAKQRFQTMCEAAKADRLALMDCLDERGDRCSVICAVNVADGEYQFVPLGTICEADNPYDVFTPPDTQRKISV